MKQNYDFINEPTKKALFRMFLPMMIGMLLNFAYNIVDTLWVGNLMGDTALAALTNATPIVTLTYSFGMGITNGMGILLSNQLAKNKKRRRTDYFIYACINRLIISAACCHFGIILKWNTGTDEYQSRNFPICKRLFNDIFNRHDYHNLKPHRYPHTIFNYFVKYDFRT